MFEFTRAYVFFRLFLLNYEERNNALNIGNALQTCMLPTYSTSLHKQVFFK